MEVPELIRLAKELESIVVIDYKKDTFKYKLIIPDVFYKEIVGYLRMSIEGYGFTIEDAAYDYLRKARGGVLVHIFNNKEIKPL